MKEIWIHDLPTDVMEIQMGPAHPAVHGIVKLMTKVSGETIVDVDPEIGYLHRGFEKNCEHRRWNQCVPYVDRLNYVSAPINDVAFCMAVEKLMGIEVPERAVFIRMLVSELSRLADHYTCVGASAMEVGAFTAFLYFMELREDYYSIIEKICGARITTNLCRVGGQNYDLYKGFEDDLRVYFKKCRKLLGEIDALLTRNRIFYDRMRNTGVISAEDALDYGLTGPMLRGSGVDLDLRKAKPYMLYDQVDFTVPVGTYGDNYDRYLCRMEELVQSMRIIEQLIPHIPAGPIQVDDHRVALVPKTETYNHIEGLIYHFKVINDGPRPPQGEVYVAVESPNGELGFYIVSDGTALPYRLRARPTSLFATAALRRLMVGGMIADLVPTFGSINMIGGELER